MYLIKSYTLENSVHTICTFDLFDKDGAPILIESALVPNGTRAVKAYDGFEEISERLWTLDLLCDGVMEVRGIIHDLHECLVENFYGSK